jgi:predicted outer membrane repeat protein
LNSISNCIFKNNRAEVGGAINIVVGSYEFRNNLFSNNSAKFFGGAIYTEPSTNLKITNCILDSNDAMEGGAIYGTIGAYIYLINSTIINNLSEKSAIQIT